MKLLQGSWVLKGLALLAAIVSYAYIHNELYGFQRRASDPSYKLIKLTAKNLPLKVRLATSPPEGYRIQENRVTTDPSHVIVIGPEVLLEEAVTAETALLDVSESTRTVTRKIPLESVAGIHLVGEPYTVQVSIPVVKEKAEEAPSKQ